MRGTCCSRTPSRKPYDWAPGCVRTISSKKPLRRVPSLVSSDSASACEASPLKPIAPSLPPRVRRYLGEGARSRIDPRFLADLLLLDEICCDSGIVRPFNAFAVYRKRR